MLYRSLIDFMKKESSVGFFLVLATVAAMLISNTSFSFLYESFLSVPVVVSFGTFAIDKPLLLWINDGLMALFFFMVGMEIKREVVEGALSKRGSIALPAFAAVGGMIVPALIYYAFNHSDPVAFQGWAIPSATDIAFALGILTLLGKRVPVGLKLFLLALAIIDDLGAIIVIALFYTSKLSAVSLGIAAVMIGILIAMNRNNIVNQTAYILIGIVLWTAVLKSGVHATLAGVVLGLLIPLKNNKQSFHALEHSLHAPVNFMILPLFAFVNTGINFDQISARDWIDPVTLGIALGLFFGKQIGIFLFSALAVGMGMAHLPYGIRWIHIYGVALLGGIGFTMSLFIGSLAFECANANGISVADERLGVLMGSILSALAGYFVLKRTLEYRDTYE